MNWKKLREDNHLSLEQASISLGISEDKLRRIENGEEEPPQLLADRIVDLYFFTNQPREKPNNPAPTNIRHLRHTPISCATCGSRDIAYVAEYHRAIGLRFFSLVFLAISIWLGVNAIITLLDDAKSDVSMSIGMAGICLIIFFIFQIAVFFCEARTHVKCVCKDCGAVWLHD